MSTPPNELPPPPPTQTPQAGSATQVVGQQHVPSTSVPVTSGALQTVNPGQTNTLAVVSLATGILSFLGNVIPIAGGFTVAIVAVITGHMARNQIKQTGEKGMGMATAGMIIGYIHLAILGLVVIAVIIAIFAFGITVFGLTRSTGG